MNLVRDEEIGQKTNKAARDQGQNVGVDVFGPIHVDPNYRGSEEQNAGVLVAGAQPYEQCSETKGRCARAAYALDREEQSPSTQHVVQ